MNLCIVQVLQFPRLSKPTGGSIPREPSPTRRRRILLVEDEKPIRDVVLLDLLYAGFDCREAASGECAIDLLGSGVKPDLVLSNLLLPEIDGLTLLLHVKRHHPQLPFVFMTAIRDVDFREVAMRNGADGFLLNATFTMALT
jgi:CheY-like chemotaxis protein